jgi:hypothetical protein
MSLAIPPAASAALTAPNVHPHGHGHKKGSETDSLTDPSSSSSTGAAQSPAGSTQNIFGTLLTSLEQVIGMQTPQPAQSALATQSVQQSIGSMQQSMGSKINVTA